MAAIHRDWAKLSKTILVALSAQSAAADNSACGVRPTQNVEYLAGSPTASSSHYSASSVLIKTEKAGLHTLIFAAITVTADCGAVTTYVRLDLVVEFNNL